MVRYFVFILTFLLSLSCSAYGSRLKSRVHPPIDKGEKPGKHLLKLREVFGRTGYLFVPETYTAPDPVPLIINLHGAGGDSEKMIERLREISTTIGAIVVAPQARTSHWSMELSGAFGEDIQFIDGLLEYVFNHFWIDPEKILIAGISNGGMYALSLGLANGDLFTHIIGVTPSGVNIPKFIGSPKILIMSALEDPLLPIRYTRSLFNQHLRTQGERFSYFEYHGGHHWRDAERAGMIKTAYLDWFMKQEPSLDSKRRIDLTNENVYYQIVSAASGMSLDLSLKEGTKVQQFPVRNSLPSNQLWQLKPTQEGYFRIVSKLNGAVLSVEHGSLENNAPIEAIDAIEDLQLKPIPYQEWQFIPVAENRYQIVSKHSNKCLDLHKPELRQVRGTIQQWNCSSSLKANQTWELVQVAE